MTQEENIHFDPPRYPRLILPIEQTMKDNFRGVMRKIQVDVTKQLTQAVKLNNDTQATPN